MELLTYHYAWKLSTKQKSFSTRLYLVNVSNSTRKSFIENFIFDAVCMLNQPFKRQPHKMVEHTQTTRRQTADKLCDCVWPFCGVCSALVLNYLEMCYWFQTVSKLFIMVLHLLCRGEKRHGLTFVIQRCEVLIRN